MARLQDLDPNFSVKCDFNPEEFDFYNVEEAPFVVEGLLKEENGFCRLPSALAEQVNPGVNQMNWHTAGGRARFRSNTTRMVIVTRQHVLPRFSHMPLTGVRGFDLYSVWDGEEHYERTFVPPFAPDEKYTSMVQLYSYFLNDDRKTEVRDMTLNFPLYAGVKELLIGLEKGSVLEAPTPCRLELPIVYYGSSITQGGCASRPGNCYSSMISRRLNCPQINLGFSGNAKGETLMAEYIRDLPMAAFVYDYDYNAPSIEHLEQTHEPFFRIIREANPDLPIIFMSIPKHRLKPGEALRREVVKRTYENALAAGDKNVYFLGGPELIAMCGTDWGVDNVHPNDLGFSAMAKGVGDLLEKLLIG